MKNLAKLASAIVLAMGGVLAACGDSGGGDGSSDGDGEGDGSSTNESGEFSCCLNGSFYDCPSSDALNKCSLKDGPGACSRDSSGDDSC